MKCKHCGDSFSWQPNNLQGKECVGDEDVFCSTGCAVLERDKRDFLTQQEARAK